MTPRLRAVAIHLAAGLTAGAGAWLVVRPVLSILPVPVRFLAVWLAFTLGPGAAAGVWLTRGLDPLRRVIVLLGIGSAASPVLIDILGRLGLMSAFPYCAFGCVGAGLATWRRTSRTDGARASWIDATACAALVALVAVLGAIVFWHRVTSGPNGIVLYGDYDSADLGYYAAEAAEATHTVPPMASYYSGHQLNAAYYAHLVLAMVHRFAGVPILSMYYGLAWPTFLAAGALTAFALIRSLTTTGVALLAVAMMLVCSDFSYLAAWFLPHAAVDWDYLLWPTNFFSTTMPLLYFSTWTPSLPVFCTALFAVVRGLQTRSYGWIIMSAAMMAVLFEFKPFAYVVVMAALCASAVFTTGEWGTRLRVATAVVLSALFTVPFLWQAAALDPSDRRTRLVMDFFLLPRRMLIKLDVADAFTKAAAHLAPWPTWRTPIVVVLATIPFLLFGIGVRWIAASAVWRAIRGRSEADADPWRLLAWCVIAGVVIPFVVTTDPYVDTIQFYITSLFLMWIFTARVLAGFTRAHPRAGALAIALSVALTLPSSLHYLSYKWTEAERAPRASLSGAEVRIADFLRTRDPETTVILHDRPLAPSLITIVAERRIVLGWDVRYSAVGGEARLRDVDAFFSSARGDPEAAFATLRRYHVTHLIVREGDRVHPAVLARLTLLMQFQAVALYGVPAPAGPS